jgi:uncharacterized membrane protein
MEMETIRIALRLAHIFSGTLWVGSAFFITLFLEPTVRAAGADGGHFMERLVTQTSLMKYMITSSLLTVVTGVILYALDAGFSLNWVTSTEGLIFTLGSVTGLGAYVTGQFMIAPTAQRIGALGQEMALVGGPPSGVQLSEMSNLQGRAMRFGRLEIVLMVISVLGMAGARIF